MRNPSTVLAVALLATLALTGCQKAQDAAVHKFVESNMEPTDAALIDLQYSKDAGVKWAHKEGCSAIAYWDALRQEAESVPGAIRYGQDHQAALQAKLDAQAPTFSDGLARGCFVQLTH